MINLSARACVSSPPSYVTAISAWQSAQVRMESPRPRTHTPVVHLTIPFRVKTFTNALLGLPRRHWNSPSFQLRLTCLVLHVVGIPIRLTPTRPPILLIANPIPSSTLTAAHTPHSPLCPRHHVSPYLLRLSFLGDADSRMGSAQRMKAVE